MDPWSGLGVGYEILSTSQTAQGITVSALPEFFSLGQYSSVSSAI